MRLESTVQAMACLRLSINTHLPDAQRSPELHSTMSQTTPRHTTCVQTSAYLASAQSHAQFILEPLYKIFSVVLGEDKEGILRMLAAFGAKLKPSSFNKDVKPLLTDVFSAMFGSASGLVEMLVRHVPSSKRAAAEKVRRLYTGPTVGPRLLDELHLTSHHIDGHVLWDSQLVQLKAHLTALRNLLLYVIALDGTAEALLLFSQVGGWIYRSGEGAEERLARLRMEPPLPCQYTVSCFKLQFCFPAA
jgi:hypothetical protein